MYYSNPGISQEEVIYPNVILTPVAFEITGPLSENPVVGETDFMDEEFLMNAQRDRIINPDILPPDFSNIPSDPGQQTKPGWIEGTKATLMNFAGQTSGSYPPDANGDVGTNYYFQVVNSNYAIYNKTTGALVAGPSPLNSIFNPSLPGAGCNSGDPIVLWDQQADRWFYAEFSLCLSNDYMLIAVSQTNNPAGSWYSWSFDVADVPDYMKFGIWQDGYYMATNTSGGNDVYVFNRATMLAGGASPTMIGFDNSWRPSTFDGFHCILPFDNDGPWAPTGTRGQFITIADDGQGNSADQLWIYQLYANWTTPSSSTFSRTQTLNVNSFSGNFNSSWNNIPQSGTTQKLDGLSTILMYRAQYRNFSGTQRLVCAHAIAESSTEASLRWYELENTGTTWTIRQQGTYNPDNISRWNMSIAMNGAREIGIGYSVCNSSMYPGIRYIGQSATANAAASSTLDMAETTIYTGSNSQTGINRWGDYSNISIDPTDDHTFWYTNEYVTSSSHGTRIASFQFSSPTGPPTADFAANNTLPLNSSTTVTFTDNSTYSPTTFAWTFSPSTVTYVGGTSSSSQNPQIRFNVPGAYTVSLYVQNASGNDTETKTNYIHMGQPGVWAGVSSSDWNTLVNWENHLLPQSVNDVTVYPSAPNQPEKTGNLTLGTDCNNILLTSGTELTVSGNLTINNSRLLNTSGITTINLGGNWTNNGTFIPGSGTVEFFGTNNSIINSPAGGPAYLINEDFNITWPGNWNGNIAGGAGQFGLSNSNIAGSTYPEAVYSREVSATNTTRRMYHDPVNTSGLSALTLSFIHSVDYRNTEITLKVQYSTDGINWIDAGWSVNPTSDIVASPVSLTLTSAEGVGAVNYYIAFVFSGVLQRIDYWYIDDVKLFYNVNGTESFNHLVISKTAASVSTMGNLNISGDFIIHPGAYFTNNSGNNITVAGSAVILADNVSSGSYLDYGTTSTSGNAYMQQYLSSERWHLISAPVAGATINTYYDIYLKEWNENDSSWTYLVQPTTMPLNVNKGYAAWASDNITGSTLVTFSGSFNTGDQVPILSYTSSATHLGKGFNLVGNPFPSSINWNSNWNMTDMSGWMLIYDNGVYRGIHTDGTPFNSKINGLISPTQGFWVRALNSSANLVIPASERLHSNQIFYKETHEILYPYIRLESEINGYNDETTIIFHPETTREFDGFYDLVKFPNIEEAPQIYSFSGNDKFAVNYFGPDYQNMIIPLGFKTGEEGIYSISAAETGNFSENFNIYLEDIKEGIVTKLSEDPVYEFQFFPWDNEHRFNLHFMESYFGIDDSESLNIRAYSSHNKIFINSGTDKLIEKIAVHDAIGQVLLLEDDVNQSSIILPGEFKSGCYILKIYFDGHSINKKIVIP
jgi:PKD repeat protein